MFSWSTSDYTHDHPCRILSVQSLRISIFKSAMQLCSSSYPKLAAIFGKPCKSIELALYSMCCFWLAEQNSCLLCLSIMTSMTRPAHKRLSQCSIFAHHSCNWRYLVLNTVELLVGSYLTIQHLLCTLQPFQWLTCVHGISSWHCPRIVDLHIETSNKGSLCWWH